MGGSVHRGRGGSYGMFAPLVRRYNEAKRADRGDAPIPKNKQAGIAAARRRMATGTTLGGE